MAITYDSGSNTITVTGSATFADIQSANDNGSWGVWLYKMYQVYALKLEDIKFIIKDI